MASPQFLHLLEQIHKNSSTKILAWQPAKPGHNGIGAFRIALGEGIIRIEAEDDDEWMFSASYEIKLLTRDGQVVDELRASQQFDTEYFTLLRDLFQSARAAAFNLDRMIDGMQDDLESGRTRELPPENEASIEIPF